MNSRNFVTIKQLCNFMNIGGGVPNRYFTLQELLLDQSYYFDYLRSSLALNWSYLSTKLPHEYIRAIDILGIVKSSSIVGIYPDRNNRKTYAKGSADISDILITGKVPDYMALLAGAPGGGGAGSSYYSGNSGAGGGGGQIAIASGAYSTMTNLVPIRIEVPELISDYAEGTTGLDRDSSGGIAATTTSSTLPNSVQSMGRTGMTCIVTLGQGGNMQTIQISGGGGGGVKVTRGELQYGHNFIGTVDYADKSFPGGHGSQSLPGYYTSSNNARFSNISGTRTYSFAGGNWVNNPTLTYISCLTWWWLPIMLGITLGVPGAGGKNSGNSSQTDQPYVGAIHPLNFRNLAQQDPITWSNDVFKDVIMSLAGTDMTLCGCGGAGMNNTIDNQGHDGWISSGGGGGAFSSHHDYSNGGKGGGGFIMAMVGYQNAYRNYITSL